MFRVSGIKRLISLDTKVETLGHQFIQQCSVSGSAKGKAKIKAAQTLKKSKTGAKKGASSGGGPRKTGLVVELEEMANKCLTAPTPMRFMKPKEQAVRLSARRLVDADAIPKYELTVEDGRQLAKEYSRVLMRKHRARQKAETTLLRLKKEAPEALKAAAMVPDLTPFPANRYMATLNPPIEGYIDKIREATAKATGKEKLR
ncbi:hypothetical protein RND81_01G011100 [Saponaria officinalis]|uniref:Uncharacterized protein n=1 Tax=Saponaria officinalis TaxID=3572 RepID=A0AAW1NBS3_SAPOF